MPSFSVVCLPCFRPRRAAPRRPAPDPQRTACDAPDERDHTAQAGPFVGWFDSSHDLRRGLAVTEHAGLDEPAPWRPLALATP